MLTKFKAFFTKYSFAIHVVLNLWNLFVTSWATGVKMNLGSLGVPIELDPRALVAAVQATVHVPTWLVTVGTLVVNGCAFYMNHKTDSAKALEGRSAMHRLSLKAAGHEQTPSEPI